MSRVACGVTLVAGKREIVLWWSCALFGWLSFPIFLWYILIIALTNNFRGKYMRVPMSAGKWKNDTHRQRSVKTSREHAAFAPIHR